MAPSPAPACNQITHARPLWCKLRTSLPPYRGPHPGLRDVTWWGVPRQGLSPGLTPRPCEQRGDALRRAGGDVASNCLGVLVVEMLVWRLVGCQMGLEVGNPRDGCAVGGFVRTVNVTKLSCSYHSNTVLPRANGRVVAGRTKCCGTSVCAGVLGARWFDAFGYG